MLVRGTRGGSANRRPRVCTWGVARPTFALRLVGVWLVILAYSASTASAVTPSGGLTIHVFTPLGSFSKAQNPECEAHHFGFKAQCDTYRVTATNSGSEVIEGSPAHPIVLKDVLPVGLTVQNEELFLVRAVPVGHDVIEDEEKNGFCVPEGTPATGVTVTCTYPEPLEPDGGLLLRLNVTVGAEAATGEFNKASVTGPGSPEAAVSEPLQLGLETFSFGASSLVSSFSGVDGTPDTQAGGHPYEFTTRIDLKSTLRIGPESPERLLTTVHDLKDVVDDLPVGMVGDAQATAKCAVAQLASIKGCPADTRVGQLVTEPEGELSVAHNAIYNLVPEKGVVAEFGFDDGLKASHVIYASVAPTPSGYVVRGTTREVPQIELTDAIATFYGNPAARAGAGSTPVAMFTNPSDCSGEPRVATVHLDSWQEPGAFANNGTPEGEPEVNGPWVSTSSPAEESPPVTGCEELRFTPQAFNALPDTSTANSPTGLTLSEQIPQHEQPGSLATPPLRDETVTLPAGLIANPSAASGLAGCSEAQVGWLGFGGPGGSTPDFTPNPPACPDASKIGSVEVITPVLEKPVIGALYLANQNENPFGSLLAGYIVIDDPTTGIIVKVPGKLTFDPSTGQITGTFTESPQLAVFSELKLRFFGGERGELATPEGCGTYTTTGVLTPWSAPESGPPANVASSFSINGGCSPAFAPSFTAATANPQADSYSPFTLSFSRQDSEQEISGLSVSLPPGLTAKIAGVGKCPEAALQAVAANPSGASEIAHPACPASSEVGTVQVTSGAGGEPLSNTGKAYFTGPYKGAPLGLAVIVPAVAGPFDLGNVVVRTALFINPNDTHVTAVSDPFPTIIDAKGADGHVDGFPIRMRSATITFNRSAYILNPTNCNSTADDGAPMSVNATLTSTSGATSASSSHFQAAGCRELPFKPGFGVSTQGHGSKASGASLHVHVTSLPGQANIAKVRTELPKQLPSWLPTLQKACLVKVFEANPAACPEGSLVGNATATSPLIATPFTGPAYLVSHGGAAFPDLEVVLQSEGITIVLDGHTDIKKGITISKFETVPDQPVTSFELNLPMGPHHVLATNVPEKLNHNLCGQSLTMPTIITGQNGAVVKQTTKISITGCPKAKKHKKAKKAAHHKKK
jgi:hypothetical protein